MCCWCSVQRSCVFSKEIQKIGLTSLIVQDAGSVYWGVFIAAILANVCLLQSREERKGEWSVKVLQQEEYTFFFNIMKITKVTLQVTIHDKKSAESS